MSSEHDDLSTHGHADLIFEVPPDADAFDDVRRAVVRRLEADYHAVMPSDVREHVRIDTVDIDPGTWDVTGRLNGGHDVGFTVALKADGDANGAVLSYLRDEVADRYFPHVRPECVVFDRIGIRPAAWFVDAKVPPAPADHSGDTE